MTLPAKAVSRPFSFVAEQMPSESRPFESYVCWGGTGRRGRHKKVPYLSVGIGIPIIATQSITTGGSDECGGPQGGS